MGKNNNVSEENSKIVTFSDSSPDDATVITYYPRNSAKYPDPVTFEFPPISNIYLVYNDSRAGSNFITAYWDYWRDWDPDTSHWSNNYSTPNKSGEIYKRYILYNNNPSDPNNRFVKAYEEFRSIEIKWYYRTKNNTNWNETSWIDVLSKSLKEEIGKTMNEIPNFDPSASNKFPYKYIYSGKEIFDIKSISLQPGDSIQDVKFSIRVTSGEFERRPGVMESFWGEPEEYTTDIINIDYSINDYYPNRPTVSLSIEGLQVTATVQLTDDDVNTKYIIFYLFDKNTETQITSIKTQKSSIGGGNNVSAVFTISYNKSYIVRAKAFNDSLVDKGYGILESAYSEPKEVTSGDVPPPVIEDPSDPNYASFVPIIQEDNSYTYRISEDGVINTYVFLVWKQPTGYSSVIQYSNSSIQLDSSGGNINTIENGKDVTSKTIGPLTTGYNYYFRIAIKNDKGNGGWSSIWKIAVGDLPDIPNVGLKNNIFDYDIGESFTVWWAHQSSDGAKEKEGVIELAINGFIAPNVNIYDFANSIGGTVIDSNSKKVSVVIKKNLSDKSTLSEWSFFIDPKYFSVNVKFTILVRIKTISTMDMASPFSKYLKITCWAKSYAYVNIYRRKKWIWNPFNFTIDTIYSALGDFSIDDMIEDNTIREFPFYVFGTVDPISSKIVDYTFTVSARTQYRTVNILGEDVFINPGDEIWSSLLTDTNARHDNDKNTVQLYMLPTDIRLQDGETYELKFVAALNNGKVVESEPYVFTVKLDIISYLLDAFIEYNKDDVSTTIQPFCYDYSGNIANYVFLSVYRENYYGEFTKIADNLNNAFAPTIKDPYPTLKKVKYRIVGIDITTGSVFYRDLPLFRIPETAIVIQWDAKWKFFDVEKEETVFFEGSLLKLPFNISSSENPEVDVSTIEYIGREYPVSYYGTHIKEVVTLQTDILRDDAETLYGLRRLAKYKGNVYVREQNGMGFLANVKVSFNIENLAVIIPVTLTVTRVEE